ncbi:4-hydroxyphenylpyruvate dioxygenase [Actinomadura opuntiae]|uniref:4-hydroxyphenylpyruvate dioxygenase n=1 Tax=Actinomadura sp. OS1-43 TaxID=604315 RepID=UPI00255B13C4|nr:4-hydroxyphenylpyruvate dioxygenase [Actinomadura sp. OS1-43]MDL4820242.1 4-hydroxyphenylpyruvate dioxygenase [Actinomadura sp. OS1-43]
MSIDHLRFYVTDVDAGVRHFAGGYGFRPYADAGSAADGRSAALGAHGIRLVLTAPPDGDHPGAAYLSRHGDGVADIALGVPDARAAYARAVASGARPVAAPIERDGFVTATIGAFGDTVHTFVQRPAGAGARSLPGLPARPGSAGEDGPDTGLFEVDHIAVCVEAGELEGTVEFYRRALGFEMIFTEHIAVGAQAMVTTVVQSPSGEVTLTLIEPDASRAAGQINDFLKVHDGPGVQHVAFATPDITRTVRTMGDAGVDFLTTPDSYYRLLPGRLTVARHTVPRLRELNVLVDEDHDGQLFQIFTRSAHPRGTLFFEVIERLGSRSFGSGNIRALYRAVESARTGAAG